MPKVVDHAQRRAEIADALWQVIRRDGIAAASVRTVAAEAGWSTGAIRHYFSTQAELLAFATTMMIQQVTERVAVLAAGARTVDDLVAVLEETLPLDAQRLADAEVWLAMVAASRTDAGLKPLTGDAYRGLRKMCSGIVGRIALAPGAPALDATLETDRLHGLIDGLALHGTLYPRQMTRPRMRRALSIHVKGLAGGATDLLPPPK